MTEALSWVDPTTTSRAVLACCSGIYASALAELLVGDSLHPGGLASTRRLLRMAGLAPGARVLDAGSGLGASARLAAGEFGLSVDAVDGSAESLQLAKARSGATRISWHLAELSHLPFDDGTFEAVLAECVLSTTERVPVLRELARVLRPGSTIMMSDVEVDEDAIPALVNHRLLGSALCVTTAWQPGELEVGLADAGFHLEQRWDLSQSIIDLVDRAEARLGLATIAARDMGLDLAALAGESVILGGASLNAVLAHDLASDVRAAVRDGRLRYFGALARVVA